MDYLHLRPGDAPPRLDDATPFKAVVVIEAEATPEWRQQVSDWLVRSGCRYMMAWGENCDDWHDSVDEANLAAFDYGDIPDEDFVMTTWHDAEPMEDVFWFSQFGALHPSLELEKTYIVHVSPEGREAELIKAFREAQSGPEL